MTAKYTDERMLVFAPHADDAEFGCGGWLVRMREEGVGTCRVVVAATGAYLRSDGRHVGPREREEEAVRAFSDLGVEDFSFGGWFTENRGLEASYPELVQSVALEIEKYQATEVFVCLPSFNQDHRVLHDAVVTAMRPGQHPSVRALWAYEYPGNAWAYPMPTWGRSYLSLSQAHVDAKISALARHASQFSGRDVAVSPRAAAILAHQRGAEVGLPFAEAFLMMREVHR